MFKSVFLQITKKIGFHLIHSFYYFVFNKSKISSITHAIVPDQTYCTESIATVSDIWKFSAPCTTILHQILCLGGNLTLGIPRLSVGLTSNQCRRFVEIIGLSKCKGLALSD